MELTEKKLEKISGAILSSFINLHLLEDAEKIGLFRQRVRNNIRRTISDLKEIEINYYNKIDEVDEKELGDKLTANKLIFLDWLLNKFDFNDFCKIQEVCLAYEADKERITQVTDEVLINSGAEQIDEQI
jgi:hypothetical protein